MGRLTHLDAPFHYNICSYADSHANILELVRFEVSTAVTMMIIISQKMIIIILELVHKKLTLVNENFTVLTEIGLKQNKLGSEFLQG
jgi:hypothetical protein